MGKENFPNPKPIAAFDLDGTLVREHLLFMLLKTFFELKIFPPAAEARFQDLCEDFNSRKIPHVEYSDDLVRLFDRNIQGIHVHHVRYAAQRVARFHRDWLYSFTKALLDAVKETHECITITGALKEVVEQLAPYWGFRDIYATDMEISSGVYTGKVKCIPLKNKSDVLKNHMKKKGAPFSGSIAVGDTGSDIAMLAAVERAFAFNPNEELAAAAQKRGWPIIIERKDCIYVMNGKGYRRFSIDDAEDAVDFVLNLACFNKKGPI